jgi:hypothetical protein
MAMTPVAWCHRSGQRRLPVITATITAGEYFHANNRQELEAIYDHLDDINPRQVETQSYRPLTDLYYWPLAAAMIISLLYFMFLEIRLRYFQRQLDAHEAQQVTA